MTKLLTILLTLLLITLVIGVFKNIGYPIIWGDEADTVMYAERILDYGYPKVHDGHNSLNYNMISGNVGVNEKYDAWTVSMWGQYYFAAPAAAVARTVDDIYQKTAVLRFPFALVGLVGILLVPLILTPVISKERRLVYWIVYVIVTILSVSLILHIKEVRSYSFSILFSALFLNLFVRFYFYKSIRKLSFYIFGTLVLFLLINTFPPAFLSLAGGIFAYVFITNISLQGEIYSFNFKRTAKDMFPVLFAGGASVPILIFFRTSQVSASAYSDMTFGLDVYLIYITRIIEFLFKYHFLSLFVFLITFLFFVVKIDKKDTFRSLAAYLKNNRLLGFLLFIFILYIPLISITPYMFDRYFLFLQPLVALLISYTVVLILELLNKDVKNHQNIFFLFIYGVVLIFVINVILLGEILKGRVYELTNKYFGPMDAIVNYLKPLAISGLVGLVISAVWIYFIIRSWFG